MAEQSAPNLIAVEKLSAGYENKRMIEGLDLTITAGSITGLLGPNGSGKSTLLRTLGRLLPPIAGTLKLRDVPLRSMSSKRFARQVGMLNQAAVAPEGLTVADLVRQGRYPHRKLFARWTARDEQACSRALQLTEMNLLADRPLDHLSGGQRQRAWISMVLAQETDILLLDEPTTYLDLAHQIDILELLQSLVREHGKTIVVVLHDINLAARYTDRVILMNDGRIVAEGPPRQTINSDSVAAVFGINSAILDDPFTGTPICVPAPAGRGPDASA